MSGLRCVSWIVCGLVCLISAEAALGQSINVGSKSFTENVVLGEIMRLTIEAETEAEVTHQRGLGGSQFLWEALRRGDVQAYPEYTGTMIEELFAGETVNDLDDLRRRLAESGIRMTEPLGFNNTYALGMTEERAAALNIRTVSDLRRHPDLALGFSNEFMDRGDGWPSLQRAYQLPHRNVRGLEHDLAYRGLVGGTLDAMDLYSTDAEIEYYGLRVLDDDLGHFPAYQAVVLYRDDVPAEVEAALLKLEGTLSEDGMIALNRQAKIDRMPEAEVAAGFVQNLTGTAVTVDVASRSERILRRTGEHLGLVLISLFAAILAGIPLGIIAYVVPSAGRVILGTVGAIYTIPSLALLVFMIPLLGIGAVPAMVALFLYSLLPIVRNTHAGLTDIPVGLRESALALGLPQRVRLRRILVPMAGISIIAGIQTAAVINVGTATLGALIGAGGYGQPILTGIRLDDTALILEGAIPAAVLALIVQGGFGLLGSWLGRWAEQ